MIKKLSVNEVLTNLKSIYSWMHQFKGCGNFSFCRSLHWKHWQGTLPRLIETLALSRRLELTTVFDFVFFYCLNSLEICKKDLILSLSRSFKKNSRSFWLDCWAISTTLICTASLHVLQAATNKLHINTRTCGQLKICPHVGFTKSHYMLVLRQMYS